MYKIFQVITASYRKFSKSEHLFCHVSKLAHTFDFCKWLFFSEKRLAKSCVSQLNNIGVFFVTQAARRQNERSVCQILSYLKNYKSQLNLYETQVAIKTVKDFFQGLLAERLHLLRVSAPLFVDPTSGLNDNLNGVERPVNFHIAAQETVKQRLYSLWPNGSAMPCRSMVSNPVRGSTPT